MLSRSRREVKPSVSRFGRRWPRKNIVELFVAEIDSCTVQLGRVAEKCMFKTLAGKTNVRQYVNNHCL